jgi:uncharacterized membrane protein
MSFKVTTPAYTGASFPIAVDISYTYDGIHYAKIAESSITFGGAKTYGFSLSLLVIGAVVILLLLLIIVSVVKKRTASRAGKVNQ